MAGKDLKSFLEKVHSELVKNSDEYRNTVSNIKVHTFYLSKDGLKEHVKFQMDVDGVSISDSDLNKICNKFFEDLRAAFMGPLQGVQIFDRQSNANEFSLTFRSISKTKGPIAYLDARTTFDFIKYIYLTPRSNFLNVVSGYYTKSKASFSREQFLHLGHAEDSSVVEQRVSDLLQYGEIPKRLSNLPEIKNLLAVVKDDDKDTVSVTLQSGFFNIEQGRTAEKDFKTKVEKDLRAAIDKLNVMELDGSDNAVVKTRKRGLKKVVKPFEKINGISINIEDTTIKKSKKSPETVYKNGKVVREKSKGMKRPGVARVAAKKATETPSFSPLRLLADLNRQLPSVVAENMQPPALQYQTGRFASSVRVTDINTTAKGFPSIGYTYDRERYETFEVGNRQGSIERDPRSLIDKSIREIAVQHALGRFYTRRV